MATVDEAVARAEIAIDALDVASLQAAIEQADAALRCLSEPVGSDHLARWYRARAIGRFVTGDTAGAAEGFRAAKALQPAWVLDPDLGPPVHQAYEAAAPAPGGVPLATPAEGWLVVDGRPGAPAPTDRPYVVQWFGSDGGLRATWLVATGGVPTYPVAAPPPAPAPAPVVATAPPPAPAPAPVVEARPRPSRSLAAAGAGAGLLAGIGIAYAAALQDLVLLSDERSSELAPLVARNRAIGYSAGALGVGAVGLGVSAVLVGRW